jgi:hypothetical protein
VPSQSERAGSDVRKPAGATRVVLASAALITTMACVFGACSSGGDHGGQTSSPESGTSDSTSSVDGLASDAPMEAAEAAEAARPDGMGGGAGDAGEAADGGDAARSPDATTGNDAAAVDADAGAYDAEGGGSAAETGPGDAAVDGCALGASGEPVDLSCAHLYSDWSSKTVYSDVVPYDPGLHLWSDGAEKQRWIHLPPGQHIDTSDMDEWTFPVGTQVWKEFRVALGDASAPTRIETRLLWKQAAGTWYRTTYRWSADGVSSATELTAGELDAGGVGYEVPNQFQCNACHSGRKDGILGFEAVSLSSPGASGITMQALVAQGLITTPPSAPLKIPGNATEAAALAYLHANCGTSCHNGGDGVAANTGFLMRLDVATLASVQATQAYTTGWNQPTHTFQIPDAAVSYRIHACDGPSSCVYYRAARREGTDGTPSQVQMPPIDSHKIDVDGVAEIAAWIDEGCDAGAD